MYFSVGGDMIGGNRVRIGFNLSREAKKLIEKLATHLGISQTSVVELAVRELARQKGISE